MWLRGVGGPSARGGFLVVVVGYRHSIFVSMHGDSLGLCLRDRIVDNFPSLVQLTTAQDALQALWRLGKPKPNPRRVIRVVRGLASIRCATVLPHCGVAVVARDTERTEVCLAPLGTGRQDGVLVPLSVGVRLLVGL